MSRRAALSSAALAAALLLGPAPARAQPGGVSDDARRQASQHFDRGIALFNEGRHDAALAELRRAYQLAPAPPVLYNLGKVQAALGHPVEAVAAFEQYLREETAMGAARRREVQEALATQRSRVGLLLVETNVDGSVIGVDGVDLTTTPMPEPIRVAAGRLVVTAHAPGYEEISRSIEVAGGVERVLRIELRPQAERRGTVRVRSPVPGVQILVDGEPVGTTPLDRTLPLAAGRHAVSAVRAGYLEERHEIEVADGAEVDVVLAMGRDPAAARASLGRLRLHLPDAVCAVRVDEAAAESRGGTLELVAGPHGLELTCADRETYRTSVEVPSGGSLDVTPALEWTPDARGSALDAASSQRTAGLWLLVPGAAVLGGSLALLLWNEGEIQDTDRLVVDRNDAVAACMSVALCLDGVDERYGTSADVASDQSRQDLLRWLSVATTGLGVVATAVGLYLVLDAPTEASVDRAAHAAAPRLRLGLGLGALSLEGAF